MKYSGAGRARPSSAEGARLRSARRGDSGGWQRTIDSSLAVESYGERKIVCEFRSDVNIVVGAVGIW